MNFQRTYTSLAVVGIAVILTLSGSLKSNADVSLKAAFDGKYLIGVALDNTLINERDAHADSIVVDNFNSIVAENCMKCAVIHPEEKRFDFTQADRFVDYGIRHNMAVIGHCLIWHSQLAPWFCVDKKGQNVSPETLKARMKNHIQTIVRRYKGRVKGWDVVNEAIEDNGSWRKSKFYEILGEDFIRLAFEYAHEADPDAELYYNDYSMTRPGRVATVVKMVNEFKAKGVRIDAIGMQTHSDMTYPDFKTFEDAIVTFGSTGCKVMITEWDMSVLPSPYENIGANISDTVAYRSQMNPYVNGVPDSVTAVWNQRVIEFFNIFNRHADIISRVTVWGLSDRTSWKNDFPVRGRTDYPLLFDRNCQPKPVIKQLMNLSAASSK